MTRKPRTPRATRAPRAARAAPPPTDAPVPSPVRKPRGRHGSKPGRGAYKAKRIVVDAASNPGGFVVGEALSLSMHADGRRLTQPEFARLIGVSPRSLRRYLAGEEAVPEKRQEVCRRIVTRMREAMMAAAAQLGNPEAVAVLSEA